jgi:hypothetical protein
MNETDADLEELQRRLDESAAAGGAHLRKIFEDERRPSAAELCAHFEGIVEVHLACTTADGAPLVAPIDAIFFRGHLWIGLPAASVRAGLVRRDPRVSVSSNERGLAVIVHGRLAPGPDEQQAEFDSVLRDLYEAQYGDWWVDWFNGLDHSGDVGGRVEPRRIFARTA